MDKMLNLLGVVLQFVCGCETPASNMRLVSTITILVSVCCPCTKQEMVDSMGGLCLCSTPLLT